MALVSAESELVWYIGTDPRFQNWIICYVTSHHPHGITVLISINNIFL